MSEDILFPEDFFEVDSEGANDELFSGFENKSTDPDIYKKNIIIYPSELETNGFCGKLYGYNRDESGVSVVFGYGDKLTDDVLGVYEIGAIGTAENAAVVGERTENGLEFFRVDNQERVPLQKNPYDLTQNIFSRNSGLLETDWMKDKCAIIVGCGSVGSIIALQLARAGVGNFVLVDTDIMEMHNVCRHQCNLTDIGKYKVDALRSRIVQTNPNAKVKLFRDTVQNVPTEEYSEYLNENSIIFGCGDNRVCNAYASDIAFHYGFPAIMTGFWQRASVCEIFYSLPERGDKCYRCSFDGPIRQSAENLARDRFYVGEEAEAAAHFEPGISADIEYGSSIASKLGIDIFNRSNENYIPKLLPDFKQYTLICNTCDGRIGGPKVEYFFKHPLERINIITKGINDCPICSRKS